MENVGKNSLISTGRDTVADQFNDKTNSIFGQQKSIKEFITPQFTKVISSQSSSGKSDYSNRVVKFLTFNITVIIENIVIVLKIQCLRNWY